MLYFEDVAPVFVHYFVPPKSLYFVFLSGIVFRKMVHCILHRGAQKYGAKILFIQQSGNESEGDTFLLTCHGFPRTLL